MDIVDVSSRNKSRCLASLTFRYDVAVLKEHVTTKLAELSIIEEEVVEVSSN